jgi:hypothetical protein
MWTIYCVTHISSGRRYIGQTKLSAARRWKGHLFAATYRKHDGRSRFVNAIRCYGAKAFRVSVLETCLTQPGADEAEIAWIASFSTTYEMFGFNVMPGGRGRVRDGESHNPWNDPAFRAKMTSPAMRARRLATRRATMAEDPSISAAASAVSKANWANPSIRKRILTNTAATKARPEVRARLSAAAKACHSPDSRARAAERQRELWSDPAFKAKSSAAIRAHHESEEYRGRARRNGTKQWKNAEIRERNAAAIRERLNSPQGLAERAARKARPCKRCGGERVILPSGINRCRPCHAARETARQAAKRLPEAAE